MHCLLKTLLNHTARVDTTQVKQLLGVLAVSLLVCGVDVSAGNSHHCMQSLANGTF